MYFGLEGSFFALFGVWRGIGANAGFNFQRITIDNSLTWFRVSGSDGGNTIITNNPKLGLKLGKVWIKAGPSFQINSNDALENWMKIGQLNYNLEVTFLL